MYIEDVYQEFYTLAMVSGFPIQRQDQSAMKNFFNHCVLGNQVTEKQANFILRLLDKYKDYSIEHGLNYSEHLITPVWKNPFRVIDNSKKIFVEEDEIGKIWLCIKFPFQLIKDFETEVQNKNEIYDQIIYDKNRKLRKIALYDANVIKIDEFVKNHGFEIDPVFEKIVSAVEEIWNNSETIIPSSSIENNKVVLNNPSTSAKEYFNQHATGDLDNDLFLAKSMGFILTNSKSTAIGKICSSNTNVFWANSIENFLEISEKINGKIAIVLDRADDSKLWLSSFIQKLKKHVKDPNSAKVGFRESNKTNPEFNQWLSENNLTGDLENAKYLIFKNKAPKWLFKEKNDIKIIATNNTFMPTTSITRHWFQTHHCLIFINEYRPVFHSSIYEKENKIVDL